MVIRSRGSNSELRSLIPQGYVVEQNVGPFYSAPRVNRKANTIAAVSSAVNLVAEHVSGYVMRTYEGDASKRQPVLDSRQAKLFQYPADGWTSELLWFDTVVALELYGNAFLWKTITPRGVEELFPLDPDCIGVERDASGQKHIYAWMNGTKREVTRNVIHIRGLPGHPGCSTGVPITATNQNTINGVSAYEEYRGRYFENDATPGIVLIHKGNPTAEQRRDIMRGWLAAHQGPKNVNMPGMLWGDMSIQTFTPSMKDSQGAELSEQIVRDIARMFRIYPGSLLHINGASEPGSIEEVSQAFFRFSIQPRIRRIERALAIDTDLFPDRTIYPAFDTSSIIRGDTTKAQIAHQWRQSGIISANEARAELGYPPHPDGDSLQITPVGGAPQEPAHSEDTNTEEQP